MSNVVFVVAAVSSVLSFTALGFATSYHVETEELNPNHVAWLQVEIDVERSVP